MRDLLRSPRRSVKFSAVVKRSNPTLSLLILTDGHERRRNKQRCENYKPFGKPPSPAPVS